MCGMDIYLMEGQQYSALVCYFLIIAQEQMTSGGPDKVSYHT